MSIFSKIFSKSKQIIFRVLCPAFCLCLVSAVSAVSTVSCTFFCATETVTFSTENPCTVYYIDAEGKPAKIYSPGTFTCTVNKNSATPFFTENHTGTIYPISTDLNSKTAFAAEILYTLYLSSTNSYEEKEKYLSSFNWNRFIEETDKFADPYLLDRQRILTAIANHNFKKTDLRILN